MINVCHHCGEYRADKIIDPSGPFAICPACGFKHPFLRLPLLLVGGPSGAGKSTVLHHLMGRVSQAVLLDSDILWRPEFNRPESSYLDFFETWLRTCKNIAQSGRPVVLFGAGFAVPGNFDNCVERRYFSELYFLALVCRPEVIVQRLQARPAWRKSADQAFIDRQIEFNQWLKENAAPSNPPIELLDTSDAPVEETVRQVAAWIERTRR